MKKTLLTLFCLFIIVKTFGIDFSADYEGHTIHYTITSDSSPYTVDVAYNFSGSKHSGDVTVPSNVTYEGKTYSVTGIEAYAFTGDISSISLPNTILTIKDFAFGYCHNLTSITIPNSVTTFGHSVFHSCTNLESVVLSNSLTEIPSSTFTNCAKLKDVQIPNSVTSIGRFAFTHCNSLKSIIIPNSVISIESYAFEFCDSLESVVLSENISTIKSYTFSTCFNLKAIDIPNSVTAIGNNAFDGCKKLESAKFSNSLTTIGSSAFMNCIILKSITLPATMTSIKDMGFLYAKGLEEITCYAVTPPDIKGTTFQLIDKSIPLYVPAESIDDYKTHPYWREFYNLQPAATVNVSNTNFDDIELFVIDGKLHISNPQNEKISLFNIKGQSIPITNTLIKGSYILKIGNRTHKVQV